MNRICHLAGAIFLCADPHKEIFRLYRVQTSQRVGTINLPYSIHIGKKLTLQSRIKLSQYAFCIEYVMVS